MAPIPNLSFILSTLTSNTHRLLKRSNLQLSITDPDTLSNLQRRFTTSNDYSPGQGTRPPDAFNNKAYFALFGLLGAAMVIASIWFFFWAKNGGFVWRQGDWEDYKSTVLRRKGPDGKTLSNATKSTRLGQQSIAGTFSDYGRRDKVAVTDYGYKSEKKSAKKSRPREKNRREPSDEDVRAYRHEKPAMVGGLNREADGSHFDYSNPSRSDLGSNLSSQPLRPKPASPKKKGFMEKRREKKEVKRQEKMPKKTKDREMKAKPLERQASFSTAETSTIGDFSEHYGSTKDAYEGTEYEGTYYDAYRPPRPQYARHESPRRQSPRRSHPNSANHSRHPSPTKHASRKTYDAMSEAESARGTKVYTHHIPELPRATRDTGYRRDAFGGRRDSLSDSDGDLGTQRYG